MDASARITDTNAPERKAGLQAVAKAHGGGTTMKAPVLLGECILRVVRAFARRYRVALGTETYREVNAIAQGAAWEWLCQQFSDPDGSERWEEVELSEEQGRAVMGFMWNELRDWWREEYRFYRHCEPLEGLDEDGEWRVRELEDVSGLAALEGVLEEMDIYYYSL
ncbi:MAG: hypothetical protein C4336_02910 [Armatimonadota bacterium]